MSEGLRQTALVLHAMHPDDRHWAMSSLDAGQRDAVSALLDELGELGIPRDATLLMSLGDDGMTARARLTDDDSRALDAMPEGVVIAMLRREPASFAERLLGLHPWTWREAWYAAHPSLASPDVPTRGDDLTPVSPVLRASMVKHARAACEALRADGRSTIAQVQGRSPSRSTSILQRLFDRRKRVRGGLA